MKESFYASACADGIHGGAVYLRDDEFCFSCQKIAIADEYKKLQIPYKNIKSVSKGKFLKTVIKTRDEKTYRFLIFNRKRFMRCIDKHLSNRE